MRSKLTYIILGSALIVNTAMADMASCVNTVSSNVTLAQQYASESPIGSPTFEGFFHMYQFYVNASQGMANNCTTGECQYILPIGCALASSTQEPYVTLWTQTISPFLNNENNLMQNHSYDPNLENGLPYLVCNYPQGGSINPQDCNVQYIR